MRADDFRSLPKAELHLHLEGAIPLETLAALAERQGRSGEAGSLEELRERFRFQDFEHFLEVFRWTVSLLASSEDYRIAAEAAGRALARQGVLYAEVMVGLGNSVRYGGHDPREVLHAAWEGFARAMANEDIVIAMHAASGRELGPDFAMELLPALAEVRDELPLVGFNIGGSERTHRLTPFAEFLGRVRDLGLECSLHAGEVTDAQDVRDALAVGARRIGHGIRAVDDPALMDELGERGVTLEVCPVSNLCTAAVPSLAEHPLPRLLAAGVPLSLASDDPVMFGTDLLREYEESAALLGNERAPLVALARQGFAAAFQPAEVRARLLERFEAGAARWLGGT